MGAYASGGGVASIVRGFCLALALGAGLALPALGEPRAISPALPDEASVTSAALAVPMRHEDSPKAETGTEQRHYNIVILGDSLGDGVWAGLYHVFHKDKRFSVIRKSRVATGFVRKDYYDWNDAVRAAAADTKIDIAVVIMGTNDRQTIIEGSERHALFEPKWRELYAARVDDFTATLKAAGARVYWLGLPVMRSPGFESDMETFSSIFEERAKANGVAFLPMHQLAADKNGNYQAYGIDAAGKKRQLRTEDGIHFTMEGYELLARDVAGVIRADVDRGLLTLQTNAPAVSAAVLTSAGDSDLRGTVAGTPAGMIATVRAGRSDDWRWTGAPR